MADRRLADWSTLRRSVRSTRRGSGSEPRLRQLVSPSHRPTPGETAVHPLPIDRCRGRARSVRPVTRVRKPMGSSGHDEILGSTPGPEPSHRARNACVELRVPAIPLPTVPRRSPELGWAARALEMLASRERSAGTVDKMSGGRVCRRPRRPATRLRHTWQDSPRQGDPTDGARMLDLRAHWPMADTRRSLPSPQRLGRLA